MSQTNQLITAPNLSEQDHFYAELLSAHDGMSDEQSQAFNARLILVLANHIGSAEVLRQALLAAR